MTILTPGHLYSLENFEGKVPETHLQFIEKDVAMQTLNDGTTTEEVMAVLIDRLKFLNDNRLPCRENSLAVTKLEEALMWLQKRTADRKARGVEGTSKA